MKDTGDLFSKICDMDNLRKAHKNAKRGKGWYAEVKCIEKDLDHYLKRLQENLIEHRYHTSEYEIFTKKESNKEREIYKLPYYPDRICQWAILQVIEPYLLNSMTKDTYSAIPNRGIQPIINQLRGYKKKIKKDGKIVAVKSDLEKAAEVKAQIDALSKELAALRKEVVLCNSIAERSGVIQEKIKAVRENEQPERKEKTDHVQFR